MPCLSPSSGRCSTRWCIFTEDSRVDGQERIRTLYFLRDRCLAEAGPRVRSVRHASLAPPSEEDEQRRNGQQSTAPHALLARVACHQCSFERLCPTRGRDAHGAAARAACPLARAGCSQAGRRRYKRAAPLICTSTKSGFASTTKTAVKQKGLRGFNFACCTRQTMVSFQAVPVAVGYKALGMVTVRVACAADSVKPPHFPKEEFGGTIA
jgi:hypothetical protein